MDWGNLTTAAVAMSLATLFVRWRWPSVSPLLATAGLGASIAVAVLSLFDPPVVLAASLALNIALIASGTDYWFAQRQAKRGSRAEETEPVGTRERRGPSDEHRVMSALRSAKTSADIAMSYAKAQDAERALPEVRAALLSAEKYFGIPTFPVHSDPVIDLEGRRRYMEKIMPFLKQGHVEEARNEAAAFIKSLEASRSSQA